MLHKKAEIGKTLTWIIATIVIIVILIFSIYISGILAKTKNLNKNFDLQRGRDLIVSKSLSGYLLTLDNGEIIYEQLRNKDDSKDIKGGFEESYGNLAKNIFLKLYKNEYREDRIWLGVYGIPGIDARKNDYFNVPYVDIVDIKGGGQNWRKTMIPYIPYALEEIKLDEKRSLILVLTN